MTETRHLTDRELDRISRVQTDMAVIKAHMEAADAFTRLEMTLGVLEALGLDASRLKVVDAFTIARAIADAVSQTAAERDDIREAIRP